MPVFRIFLLSPAFAGGKKAQLVMQEASAIPIAARLHAPGGAPIGDVFAFLSSLYFRGKLAYVRAFARPPAGLPGALVITPTRGLVPADAPIGPDLLREFSTGDIDLRNEGYRAPLDAHARALCAQLAEGCEVVLLGSIATGKYVDLLIEVFGERLLFPVDFVGRGDMSRGGLMLRAASSGTELEYRPVVGAIRRGARPPKLEPRRWTPRRG